MPLPIIFLTVAQAEGIGHVEPVKVILEEISVGAAGGVVVGGLGDWVLGLLARPG